MDRNFTEWEHLDQHLGRRLRDGREYHGWSQQDMVDKLHDLGLTTINTMTISRIESGTRPVRAVELHAIGEVFGVNPWELLRPSDVVELDRLRWWAEESRTGIREAVIHFMETRRDLREKAAHMDLGPEEQATIAGLVAERPEEFVAVALEEWDAEQRSPKEEKG